MKRVTRDDVGYGHCWNDAFDAADNYFVAGLHGYVNGDGRGVGPNGRIETVYGDGDHTYGYGDGNGGSFDD